MLFKRKKTEPSGPDPAADDVFEVDAVPESHRVPHGRYTVIPKAKQLHNGHWIVDIVLQEERADGSRRLYDFFGPMTEHASEEEARRVGVEHAVHRLDAQ